jgi:hypothetical protein
LESLKRKVAGPTSVSTTAAPTMTGGRSSIPPGVTPTKPTPLVPPAPGRGPGGRQVDPGFYRDDPRKRKPRNPSTVSTSRYPR